MRKILYTLFSYRGINAGLLLLRVSAGLMLLRHAIQKIEGFDQLAATFADPFGLGPKTMLIIGIIIEAGASVFIALGLFTRVAAFGAAVMLAVAALLVHQPFSIGGSELPLIYMFIFLSLMFTGAGRFSVDEFIRKRIADRP